MKIYFWFFLVFIFCSFLLVSFANDFTSMIRNMNIAMESQNGFVINYDIYEQYNQFVYGSPLDIKSGQRFKATQNGKWTQNGGAWNETRD